MAKTDLDYQDDRLKALTQVEKDAFFIFPETFLRSMREVPYRNVGFAFAEFTDNSIEAQAKLIEVVFEKLGAKYRSLAHVCNGTGMRPEWIPFAMAWGGTSRDQLGAYTSLGRFGFGLPSAALWMAKHWSVYSRCEGGSIHRATFDFDRLVDTIRSAKSTSDLRQLVIAKEVTLADLPEWLVKGSDILKGGAKSFTAVVLDKPDKLHAGAEQGLRNLKRLNSIKDELSRWYGLIYGVNFPEVAIKVDGDRVQPVDPFFMDEDARDYYRNPKNPNAQPDPYRPEAKTVRIDYEETLESTAPSGTDERPNDDAETHKETVSGTIEVTIGYVPRPFYRTDPRVANRSFLDKRLDVLKATSGIMIRREGRLIECIRFPSRKLRTDELFFRFEIDFPATLDRVFEIGTRKERITLGRDSRVWKTIDNELNPVRFANAKRKEADKLDAQVRTAHNNKRQKRATSGGQTGPEALEIVGASNLESIVARVAEEHPNPGARRGRIHPEQQRRGRNAAKDEIDRTLAEQGHRVDDEVERTRVEAYLRDSAKARPYAVDEVAQAEAPFIMPGRLDFSTEEEEIYQRRFLLNTSHVFYGAFYQTLDPLQKDRLKLLLATSMMDEVEATDDDERRSYEKQRKRWSARIDEAFHQSSDEDERRRNRENADANTLIIETLPEGLRFNPQGTFGESLKKVRKMLGLNQGAVATRIKEASDVKGLSQTTVSRAEKDIWIPSPVQRVAIYDALEMTEIERAALEQIVLENS